MKTLKRIALCVAAASVLMGCSRDVERKQAFDADWEFSLDGDTIWRTIDLPHDWSIAGKFSEDHKMGGDGGYLPDGVGIYRKHFKLGKEYEGKKVSLYFEGVYMDPKVTVNGQEAGSHHYGYSPFSIDITPYITTGDNMVEVTVDNTKQPNCRWYTGSGIYRHVWLVATEPVHIKQWGNFITTPEVTADKAVVSIQTTVQNETDAAQTVVVKADIVDGPSDEKTVEIPAHSEQVVDLAAEVTNPVLWDVWSATDGKPHLYEANISVMSADGKKTIDAVSETFGIRTIDYSAEEGFKLNGRPLTVFGGCIHHDNGILGAAAYDRAEVRKVQMMRDAGYNAIRTSHNHPSEAFLHACDSLGMMVIDEAFDGWYSEKKPFDYHIYIASDWQDDLSALVLRDRNHPSIICWSIGNEIIERDEPQAVETAHKFVGLCHDLDPTRPVTQALACWNDKWTGQDALAAEHDVVGYNYMLGAAESDHQRVPERIIWQTESFPRDVYNNYKHVTEKPYVIGDFVWTAIDYLGESGIGRYYYEGETPGEHWQGTHYPWHGAYCGDIDLTGWRKPISYYRQVVFAPESSEDVHLAVKEPDGYHGKIYETSWSVWPTWDSWNWPGWEGKPIQVEVYSKHPSVSLYLNGEEVTDFVKNNEFLTTFTVPYTEGTLRAVANVDGQQVGEATLETAGQPVALRMTPDRTVLAADGQDLSFITVEAVDADGRVCPNAEIEFVYQMGGFEASVIGLGNANLKDTDPYYNNKHKTWKGRAMMVVRSSRKEGSPSLVIVPISTKYYGDEVRFDVRKQ